MNNFKYLDDAMMTGVVGGLFHTPGKEDVPADPQWGSEPGSMDNGFDGMADGMSHKP